MSEFLGQVEKHLEILLHNVLIISFILEKIYGTLGSDVGDGYCFELEVHFYIICIQFIQKILDSIFCNTFSYGPQIFKSQILSRSL